MHKCRIYGQRIQKILAMGCACMRPTFAVAIAGKQTQGFCLSSDLNSAFSEWTYYTGCLKKFAIIGRTHNPFSWDIWLMCRVLAHIYFLTLCFWFAGGPQLSKAVETKEFCSSFGVNKFPKFSTFLYCFTSHKQQITICQEFLLLFNHFSFILVHIVSLAIFTCNVPFLL